MSVESILAEFGKKLVIDLRANLREKQMAKAAKHGTPYNENSKLSGSIQYEIENKGGMIGFSLIMEDYYYWVDGGRDAGNVSETGQKRISYWIKAKGLNPKKIISEMRAEARAKAGTKGVYKPRVKLTFEKAQKQFTFLVARKLKDKGYGGNLFYSEVISDGRLDQLREDIKTEMNQEIEILIKDLR